MPHTAFLVLQLFWGIEMLLAQELLTRLVPIDQREVSYIRNRLQSDRPPRPKVDDQLFFRRNEWDTDDQLYLMRVVEVQPENDTTSEFATNLVQHLRHNISGSPLFYLDGEPVLVPLPDPWPWVKFIFDGEPSKETLSWQHRPQMTFESRLRGSPGWLPLNYIETRRMYLPGEIPDVQMPAYRFNGTALEIDRGDGNWLPYLRK